MTVISGPHQPATVPNPHVEEWNSFVNTASTSTTNSTPMMTPASFASHLDLAVVTKLILNSQGSEHQSGNLNISKEIENYYDSTKRSFFSDETLTKRVDLSILNHGIVNDFTARKHKLDIAYQPDLTSRPRAKAEYDNLKTQISHFIKGSGAYEGRPELYGDQEGTLNSIIAKLPEYTDRV
jgi:hypothetical protein